MVGFEDYLASSESLIEGWHGGAEGRMRLMMMLPVHNPEGSRVDSRELKAQAEAVRSLTVFRFFGMFFCPSV